MKASFALKCLLLPLLVLADLQVVDLRTAPKFAGQSIPDPPRQKELWTPPQTKLPRFLVSATATLFEQGMADPRGCEYREVEIGEGTIIKTQGFVLPERPGEASRFVVSWDGVVYPALSVGAVADLDQDVRTLAESMKRARVDDAGGFADAARRGMHWSMGGPSGADSRSALKLCLLLHLGRADLAEVLFAAGRSWRPDMRGQDLTDYHMSYLTLATDWAAAVFLRLVNAHRRGDDAIALDAARRLSAFAKAVDTKAEAMGFERIKNLNIEEPPAYLPFLRQLPELLADQERRAREPARGPIPKRGGDPSARIAALIRDLDQIDEPQTSHFGGHHLGASPLVRALAAEGEAALEPLLAAFETERRLTRLAWPVTYGRGFSIDHTVRSVFEAELSAIAEILQTNDFGYPGRLNDLAGRKKLTQFARAFWEKNRTLSMNERRYRTLRDDMAGYNRWLDAAREIVLSGNVSFAFRTRPRKSPLPPMQGEELRARRDPSISELLTRRIADIVRSSDPVQSNEWKLNFACELAFVLARWDSKAARPVLRSIMPKCREMIERKRNGGDNSSSWRSREVAELTVIRAEVGDREALDEYAAWLRTTVPKELEPQGIDYWEPIWTYPDHPSIAEVARWLFNDPASPYVLLLRSPGGGTDNFFGNSNFGTSPLLTVAGFRDGLIAAMAGKSAIGTVRRDGPDTITFKTNDGTSGGLSSPKAVMSEVKPGVDVPFRACDYIAWKVSSLEGAPECELYWPEDRRDRAVEACTAYLKRYGDRFKADPPSSQNGFLMRPTRLAFPALARPATLADVGEARAIFSLEGQGEVRTAKVPELPIQARWVTLKDFPVDLRYSDGTVRREYQQDGWIWQAEEVRKGDRWERYFGFVGPHVIARVPAAEIELSSGGFSHSLGSLPGGLDVRVEPVEPPKGGHEPGQPIRVTLQIRNRRGDENASPTEFLRQVADGRPALRRGVALAVFYSRPSVTRSEFFPGRGGSEEELKPRRTDRFDPGVTTRPLAPFEAFEAMRLDLNEWFDLTRPGSYRAHVTFAADSGVGAGETDDWHFTVGDREDAVP